jgi:hypothetical protein
VQELLEAALELAPSGKDARRALLLATLSSELWSGNRDRRVSLSDEALEVARQAGDGRVLAEVMYRRGLSIAEPATLAERLELTAELLTLTDNLADPLLRCLASLERMRAAIESCDLGEAVRHADRSRALAAESGHAYARWSSCWSPGWQHALAGRYEEAERAAGEALAEAQATQQPDAYIYYGAQIATIRWHQGRLGEIAAALGEAARLPDALPSHRALAALALAEAGSVREAGQIVDEEASKGFPLPMDAIWLTGTMLWGETCALTGHREAARVLLARLVPWCEQVSFTWVGVFGAAARVAAQLAALIGREDADDLFRLAEEMHQRLESPPLLVRTWLDWAGWLAKQGDSDRARELRERASQAQVGGARG